jgi:hypothetical protein
MPKVVVSVWLRNPSLPTGPRAAKKDPLFGKKPSKELSTAVSSSFPAWVQLVKSPVSKPQFATRLPATDPHVSAKAAAEQKTNNTSKGFIILSFSS